MKKRFKLYLLFVLLASLVLTAFVPQTAAGEMAEAVRPEKIDPALWDVLLAADEETLSPLIFHFMIWMKTHCRKRWNLKPDWIRKCSVTKPGLKKK